MPPNSFGLYFYGQNPAFTAFGNGTRCVGNPVFRLPIVQANPFGETDFAVDYGALHACGTISAGQTWNFQYWYRNPAGRFAVPILFFSPDGAFTGRDDRIAQHLDLLPSILDLSGYEGTISAFGQSVFRRDRTDRAAIFLGGQYRLLQEDRLLLFDGATAQGLYDHRNDTLCVRDLRASEPERAQRAMRDLQAIIQRHGEALVGNTLVAP